MNYVSLKNHTEYSLLESVVKVEDYVSLAKKNNMKYIGISDTNMYAIMKMYYECQKQDIDLVIGLELYTYGLIKKGEYAITVYAKNYEGYKELIKLNKIAREKINLNRNIIDIQEISYCKNIAVLIGGINSEIYASIEELDYSTPRKLVDMYKNKFKDLYIELINTETLYRNLQEYVDIAYEKEVELIATNDVYYLYKEDYYLQKVVSAIRENTDINNVKRYYRQKDLYFKNEEEIRKNYEKLDKNVVDKAIENTYKLAEKCKFKFDFSKSKLPRLELGIEEKEYLKNITYANLEKKYKKVDENIKKRLDYELNVIDKMGFNAYFIIVQDIINFSRLNNILVGPGRGSAAGSLVSYLLDITKVDPIKYDLMFERFLNSGRKNLPDIDMDFETNRKDEVIQYVMDKYGRDYVSNIITFSKLKEKQLKKDLCRVYKCKETDKRLIPIIEKLKNNVRHSSIHASGVIISKNKLEDEVPIIKEKSLNINITQYQMEELEKMGLLKMDFLSLANLDILADVSAKTNVNIDDIILNDDKTFDIYNKGNTVGIFQAESYGITELFKKYKINKFTDISSVLALYRPGPLKSGLIDKIIEIKNKDLKKEYIFDELEEILSSTYGLITYQEQVMKIAEKIADFNLNESDDLRRAMSKKKHDILEHYKLKFINNAINKGYEREKILTLYSQIENFCEYGFNKSHTIPYALISYYTAYFKANYTKQYICSLLNSQISVHTKTLLFYNEMEKFNIKMLRPCVNLSSIEFRVEDESIRYGLYGISMISNSFAQDIVKEREKNYNFKDVVDFVYRMLEYNINENQYEALVKSGALDCFNISRNEMLTNMKKIFEISRKRKEKNKNIGIELFFIQSNEILEYNTEFIKEYTNNIKYRYEFETLGIVLSIKDNQYMNVIKNKKILVIDDISLINGRVIKNEFKNKGVFVQLVLANNKYINLADISAYKKIRTNILLDNLNSSQKQNLKEFLIKNGGYSKVYFYENKERLISKKDTFLKINKENIENLINLVGFKNITIKLEM